MPLINTNPEIQSIQGIKHFTWDDIVMFGEKNRPSFYYLSGFPGDWKNSRKGADGFFLVTVNGFPYWSDAIGQIPFALDTFRSFLLASPSDSQKAAKKTLNAGQKYGDGRLNGFADFSNSYDNDMIKRAVWWAKQRYSVYRVDYDGSLLIYTNINISPNLLGNIYYNK